MFLEYRSADPQIPKDMSYHCTRQELVNATERIDGTNDTWVATISMSKVQWQAFRTKENDQYDFAKDCDSSADTPDIVPIAVGLALAGLVVVVLLAFLVGRRRAQSRGGYLSM